MGGESWEAHAARPLAASPIFSALAVRQQALALAPRPRLISSIVQSGAFSRPMLIAEKG